MDLPSNQTTFDFDFTSEFGNEFKGEFTVLRSLDMRTRHRLELEKTRILSGAIVPTDELAGIAVILSTLRHRVIDGPKWWKDSDYGWDITDLDALSALYDRVLLAESEWRKELKEKAAKLQKKS